MPATPSDAAQALLIDGFQRIGSIVHAAAKDLGEQELAHRPAEDANSIAWLLWHLARGQDAQLAALRHAEQVWTAKKWYDKFDLPLDRDETGYGHSSQQVSMVQAPADLLTGYYDDVQKATLEYIRSLKPEDYDEIVDPEWDPPVTLAVRLISVMADDLQHAGQAMYVRGLI